MNKDILSASLCFGFCVFAVIGATSSGKPIAVGLLWSTFPAIAGVILLVKGLAKTKKK